MTDSNEVNPPEGDLPSNVVRLPVRDEGEEPHLVGTAVCSRCRHRWQATAPVGTINLKCPSCRRWWGAFESAVVPGVIFTCGHCGEGLFWITPPGRLMCRSCGEEPKGWF